MAELDNLLSVRQVAFILKVHPLTIRRYIKEGKLKAVRVGRNVRIKESAVTEISREFQPMPRQIFIKLKPAKVFTEYDPLLRLKGIGAGLKITS
jgi:excisionase family DNA binding protein